MWQWHTVRLFEGERKTGRLTQRALMTSSHPQSSPEAGESPAPQSCEEALGSAVRDFDQTAHLDFAGVDRKENAELEVEPFGDESGLPSGQLTTRAGNDYTRFRPGDVGWNDPSWWTARSPRSDHGQGQRAAHEAPAYDGQGGRDPAHLLDRVGLW